MYKTTSKFSKKQLAALMKDKNFKHTPSDDETGEYEIELDELDLKEYNKLKRMREKKKPFIVKNGSGIFKSLKRGFQKMGNTLKSTFSEKNLKGAAKVAIPAVVGGLTSFAATPVASAATGNPVSGVVLGSLAGAAASQGAKVGLNKALGDGIKTGGAIADVVMSIASDPAVKQALISAGLMAGSYLTKKGLDFIANKMGRKKFETLQKITDESGVMESNPHLRLANQYYKKGQQEQERFNALQNNVQTETSKPVRLFGNKGSGVKRAGGSFAPLGRGVGGSFKPLGGSITNKVQHGAHQSNAKLGGSAAAALIESQQFTGLGPANQPASDPSRSAIHERMAHLRELKAAKRREAKEM